MSPSVALVWRDNTGTSSTSTSPAAGAAAAGAAVAAPVADLDLLNNTVVLIPRVRQNANADELVVDLAHQAERDRLHMEHEAALQWQHARMAKALADAVRIEQDRATTTHAQYHAVLLEERARGATERDRLQSQHQVALRLAVQAERDRLQSQHQLVLLAERAHVAQAVRFAIQAEFNGRKTQPKRESKVTVYAGRGRPRDTDYTASGNLRRK